MAFGQPSPVDLPQAQPLSQLPAGGPLASAFAPLQNKPKINWLGVLADALSGAAGQTPLYTQGLLQQRQQDREEQTYERRQNAELEQQKNLFLWRQEHPQAPEPSAYEREVQASGLQPGTPEYQARINSHLNAVDDPIVTVNLPGNRVYSGPRSGLAGALSGGGNPDTTPTVEDGFSYTPGPGGRANQANWKSAGGPTHPASGGFRTGKH